jgi:hypothetical protein
MKLKAIILFLSGKKAIITGGVMIVLGLLQNNQDMILQGLSVIFLRLGISKINV